MSNFKHEQLLQTLNNDLNSLSNEISALGNKDDKENAKIKSKLMKKYKTIQSIISDLIQLKMIS